MLAFRLADTAYGEGLYGAANYGGSNTIISLPNTGSGWAVLIGSVLLVVGAVSVVAWRRQQRKRKTVVQAS
jgi:LPXTG-motif cell wall-anchored protein